MKAIASPNIALIKYWGKKELDPSQPKDELRNLPLNPSLSLTLSKARTFTRVDARTDSVRTVVINQKPASPEDFAKVLRHLERVADFCKVELPAGFEVESFNNFPAGTGIASSASAFAALTLATVGAFKGEKETLRLMKENPVALSKLARRGSGSACRSLSGAWVLWREDHGEKLSVDWNLRDTLVIFSNKHKAVPSSEGHKRVLSSPYFQRRLDDIQIRLAGVLDAIDRRDLMRLGRIAELEARDLHHIAETSEPAIHYALPETKKFLDAIEALPNRNFFYTLDAGPNVHLISEEPIRPLIQALLDSLGLTASIWEDRAGHGPEIGQNLTPEDMPEIIK